jgi:two-component system nitrogen regulation sensor histidine kinase NtrY
MSGPLLSPNAVVGLALARPGVAAAAGGRARRRLTRTRAGAQARRRRGRGLHVRLVLLFSGVAMTPTILVALFAAGVLNLGVRQWFAEPVRQAPWWRA